MKLNLGCGNDIKKDYVNCDIVKGKCVDEVFDLNNCIPFPNSTVDEIFASHIIEHLNRPDFFIAECHRVLKKGGKLIIKCPYSFHNAAMSCWQHKHFFNYERMKSLETDGIYVPKFSSSKVRLRWGSFYILSPFTWLAILVYDISPKLYEDTFIKHLAPAFEIICKAIK